MDATQFSYSHTQPGTVVRVAIGVTVAGLMGLGAAGVGLAQVIAVVFIVPLLLFHSLQVQVTATAVHLAFGVGLISKTIPLDQISSSDPVRNRWYYGFGIRYTFMGWMWNVSGLDAVEVTYTNGKRFRIGTDDPQGLAAAISRATQGR